MSIRRLAQKILRQAVNDLKNHERRRLSDLQQYLWSDLFGLHLAQTGYPPEVCNGLRDSLRQAMLLSEIERFATCHEVLELLDALHKRRKDNPP